MHLVEQVLRKEVAHTVKDIAGAIHRYDDERQQDNLEGRVRRALKLLEDEDIVAKDAHHLEGNILIYHYKIREHERNERQGPARRSGP